MNRSYLLHILVVFSLLLSAFSPLFPEFSPQNAPVVQNVPVVEDDEAQPSERIDLPEYAAPPSRPLIERPAPRRGVRPQTNPESQNSMSMEQGRNSTSSVPASLSASQNSSMLSGSFAQSINVAVISSLNVASGGTFPTTTSGLTGSFTDFNFFLLPVADVRSASLGPGGICGAPGCDTVLLNVASNPGLLCNINELKSHQKADLVSFVGDGHKLIIYDSECAPQDYSWLPYPFTTSNPGQMGAPGTLSIVEENTLSSNNPADSHYIDVAKLGSWSDAVGDMNVMTTYNTNWFMDMAGTNYLDVTGPVHTYAVYPPGVDGGLIIYNGLDVDYMSSTTVPNYSEPDENLAKIWLQELQQPFNPSGLQGSVSVITITLTPTKSFILVDHNSTITATVSDLLRNPQPGISVSFSVASGPNAGATGACSPNPDCTTNANGQVSFTYTGSMFGRDLVKGCFTTEGGQEICSQNASVDWGAKLPDHSVKGPGNEDNCFSAVYRNTQAFVVKPINTRTGSLDYSFEDINIQTVAGELSFQRDYASEATGAYTQTLGFGWTHSLDSRLIFPGDPGGQAGMVLFKAHTVNTYNFIVNQDETFSAYPGLCATLTRQSGPPVTYLITDQAQGAYIFDEQGKLLQYKDPQGHSLIYTYDAGTGWLSQVADGSGSRYLRLTYDPTGQITSVTDHTNRQVTFTYTNGNLASATNTLSQTWTYQYEDPLDPHHLTEVIDPGGNTNERTEYDAQGRAVRQYDGLSNMTAELSYNPDGTTTITQMGGGAATTSTHTYDEKNTLLSEENALGGISATSYDPNFRPASITDPLSHTVRLNWDGSNLMQMVDAAGNQTDLTYDAFNNLTSIIDPNGFLTTFVYNGTLLVSSTDALNNTTGYSYTTAADAPQPPGLLKSITDPAGLTTTFTYDEFGQRISMTNAQNRTTRYTYDTLGRLQVATSPEGLKTGPATTTPGGWFAQCITLQATEVRHKPTLVMRSTTSPAPSLATIVFRQRSTICTAMSLPRSTRTG